MTPEISVVVPVFREAPFLEELVQRLGAVLAPRPYEIVFVDDGSCDGSLAILRRLRASDPRVRLVKLTRNFGQVPATVAGIRNSRGEIIVTMDADLENFPEDIPALLERLGGGIEVVHGVRTDLSRAFLRRLGSALVGRLLRRIRVNTPADVTSFRAMTRRTAVMALEYKESARFLVPAISWTGSAAAFVAVRHENRPGRSSYSLWRLAGIALELVISLSYLPLRLSLIAGLILSAISILVGVTMVVLWATGHVGVPGYTSILVAISFLAGIQLAFMGVIGEYIARLYIAQKERPSFHVDWVDQDPRE